MIGIIDVKAGDIYAICLTLCFFAIFLQPPLPSSAVVPVPRGRILKDLPPKPTLTLTEQTDGIVLSWNMKLSTQHAEIASYQIYACQESLATSPGKTSSWKKVGDVKALPLPMACTLSQVRWSQKLMDDLKI